MSSEPRILYCNCTYAQILNKRIKAEVLRRLCTSGKSFEAVADLCEMAARRDARLNELADSSKGPLKIAACYPRAVKWLFGSVGAELDPNQTEILNMRDELPEDVIKALLEDQVNPNLPRGKGASPHSIQENQQGLSSV